MSSRVLALAMLVCVVLADSAVANAAAAASVKDVYPYLYSTFTRGAFASATLADMSDGLILQSGKLKITQKDLDEDIAKVSPELRPQLKRNLFFVLENKAGKMMIDYEAGIWAKENQVTSTDPNEQLKSYLVNLIGSQTVSDDEVKAFYEDNKGSLGGATFDQVKDQARQVLLSQKRDAAIANHIATLGDRYYISINKKWAAKQYSAALANPVDLARRSGKPTMVDFGRDGCRPCEWMAPILESLKTEYDGRANILFVHTGNEQVLAERYGAFSIPLQVFFDKDGREVFRHVGFFPKDQIVAKLTEIGAK